MWAIAMEMAWQEFQRTNELIHRYFQPGFGYVGEPFEGISWCRYTGEGQLNMQSCFERPEATSQISNLTSWATPQSIQESGLLATIWLIAERIPHKKV